MSNEGVVYALRDIRDGEVRYVGKTQIDPDRRLGQHRHDRSECWKARWIRAVGPENVGLRILERVPIVELLDRERFWIERFRADGARLTNLTDGGEYGGIGFARGDRCAMRRPEVRAKVSAALKGRKITWADKISASRKGQRPSAETRAKLSDALRGRAKTEAHRAAIRAAQPKRIAAMSPEERSDIARRGRAGMSAERRSEIARKGHVARRKKAVSA